MTPSSRDTALNAIKDALVEVSNLEEDSSMSGRSRMRVAAIKSRLLVVAEAMREVEIPAKKDPSGHLGAVSEQDSCERIGNGDN